MSLKNSFQNRRPEAGSGNDLPKLLEPEALSLFEDILKSGNALRVSVTGGSMAPFLCGGDIVTIKQTDCRSLNIGDLIFFKSSQDLPILHRIIRKKRTPSGMIIFQTKGDALIAPDEPVEPHRVLGKVYQIEQMDPAGRRIRTDMESTKYRTMSYGIAIFGLAKSRIYQALFTLKKTLFSP